MTTTAFERACEAAVRALWFEHVDQHGYPNGLPTWDELIAQPENDTARIAELFRAFAQTAVRAVLLAVREPSPEMVEAYAAQMAQCEDHPGGCTMLADHAWTAMIDSLLSEDLNQQGEN